MKNFAVYFLSLITCSAAFASGDVGSNVRDELAYVQTTPQFQNIGVDHGPIAGGLQRWKLATADQEQHIFTIDGAGLNGRVVRETYIRMTEIDPYGLRLADQAGQQDLREVLTPREYTDYARAAQTAIIAEAPLHVEAYFYRGTFAAYEVLEPTRRALGIPGRFEWRSFPLSQLAHTIATARACNNGEDCAAWY